MYIVIQEVHLAKQKVESHVLNGTENKLYSELCLKLSRFKTTSVKVRK